MRIFLNNLRNFATLITLVATLFVATPVVAHDYIDSTSTASYGSPAQPRRTAIEPSGDSDLECLSAQSWLMVDGRTGKVLSTKNADRVMYPASMTKMMTCILAVESDRLNDTVTISRNAASTPYGKVHQGERFVLRNLLDVMMLDSDNGAATAISEFLGDSTKTFITKMNEKAKSLGMKNTRFANPHGLHDQNHYTTASDIMLLERYCMQNPTFASIVSQASKDVPLASPSGRVRHCNNTNKLLTTYDGAVGCKTGYTRPAGGCLASCAVRNDLQVFLVVMNCTPARQRMSESAVLLDKGFDMAQKSLLEDRRKATSKPPVPPRAKKPHESQKPVPERRKKK